MTIENFRLQFDESGKALIKKAVEETRRNGVCRISLPLATAITIRELQKLTPRIAPLLKDCETTTEVLDRLSDILGAVPGLDFDVVKDYALIYSYRMDLLPDADCETFISEKGKAALAENQITVEDIRTLIRQEARDAYYRRAMIFFINHLKDGSDEVH